MVTTAQKQDVGCKPSQARILFHDYIDREQRLALASDGKTDNKFEGTNNEEVNFLITNSLSQRVDNLQCAIEKDTLTNHQKKVTYLRGLEVILRNFTAAYKSRRINPAHIPQILDGYEKAMELDKRGVSIQNLISSSSYDVGNFLNLSDAFGTKPEKLAAKNIVTSKYLQLHPEKIFSTLRENPDLPNRDSLILIAAYKYPRQLYDYSAATNKLAYIIRNMNDPMVQTVSKMANSSGSGQMYFPFLDNIIKGRITLPEIDAVKNDSVKYYRLLVKTKLDYVKSQLKGETLYEMKALTDMLERKAKNVFVRTINGLHESPDAVRFRILAPLTAEELYYVAVSSEDEIYTSSYTHGVYPAMMKRIGNRGDSLLMSVGFDRFKKFVRMAAGYNTLSDFLATFPDKSQAEKLMVAFVDGLEKTKTLEDGVDVADSYASISETIKPLAASMLQNVKVNYDRNAAQGNKRGMIIYNLLYKLFLSADSVKGKDIDLSKEFGIPPVYSVSNAALLGDTNRVFIQVFFYGDKDGKGNYARYISHLQNKNWKKTEDYKEWIAFSSTVGKPVTIYANKPLDEESGELDKAQEALDSYLKDNGVQPTIVVHRGHSYYAPYTIQQIQPSAKIVFLGSCGGFNLINEVLKRAPEAHIIASKQTGKQDINQPFMDLLDENIRAGKNIDWIVLWREFKKRAGNIEGFDDYIPPHKNLGAIFIKAYNQQMGTAED